MKPETMCEMMCQISFEMVMDPFSVKVTQRRVVSLFELFSDFSSNSKKVNFCPLGADGHLLFYIT